MVNQSRGRDKLRSARSFMNFQQDAGSASADVSLPGRLAPGVSRLLNRVAVQFRAAVNGPLRPFPIGRVPVPMAVGGVLPLRPAVRDAPLGQRGLDPQDFYRSLARIEVPNETVHAVHAFIATLPSWLAPPSAQKHGESQVELQWNARDSRFFRAVIGADGMVIYSARLSERGRIEGAEPIGQRLSPIVMHAIRQLGL